MCTLFLSLNERMFNLDYNYPEINSAFHVKIMLCFILNKINRTVTEKQLYEIVLDSEIINYFYYAEAITELVENGSITKETNGDETYIILNDKGRHGSEYFNSYIPEFFHKKLLKSAYSLFSKLAHENETDFDIIQTENGCEINCTIKDISFDLMRITLYAPDIEQADVIKEKILKSPAKFYQKVIEFALDNTEDDFDVDIAKNPKKFV